jgi:hypothetical protein
VLKRSEELNCRRCQIINQKISIQGIPKDETRRYRMIKGMFDEKF